MSNFIIRVDSQGLGIVLGSLLYFPLLLKKLSQLVVCLRIMWFYLQSPGVMGSSLLDLSLFVQENSQVVVGLRIIRFNL